jgi:8-oxo-dGTP diphosphatase
VSSATLVVAGIIERDGRVLICQRRADSRHPLKWEFPGGKVEEGEDPAGALARELKEELAIEAEAGEEMWRCRHQYPGRPAVLLVFLRVAAHRGTPVNLDFAEIRWEERERLGGYDFLEGDAEFVRRFARGEL